MRAMTRRRFLQYGLGAGAALALPWAARIPLATGRAGGKLAKYVAAVAAARCGDRGRHPEWGQPVFVHSDGDRASAAPSTAADAVLGLRRRVRARRARPGRSGWRSSPRAARRSTSISRTTCRPRTRLASGRQRLTPLGDQVRVMTHLHGGFVAADSDGNPAVTPNGFGPGDTQTVFYTNQRRRCRPRCSGSMTTASAPPG